MLVNCEVCVPAYVPKLVEIRCPLLYEIHAEDRTVYFPGMGVCP